MEQVKGRTILDSIGIGKILFYSSKQYETTYGKAESVEQEITRYETAKKEAMKELRCLHKKAVEEVGEEVALIFAVHEMILEDDDYSGAVRQIIRSEGVSADEAVAKTGENFAAMFLAMKDDYFHARAVDVKDVSNRVEAILRGEAQRDLLGEEPVIIAAEDLTPSELLQMDRNKLKGIVLKRGAANSHVAILAKTMHIPTLLGVEISKEWNGRMAIVDGLQGLLLLDPDVAALEQYEQIHLDKETEKLQMSQLKGCPDRTRDGRELLLYANVNRAEEVLDVLENDAAGIGVFRSECLYLERDAYPSEEEQFQAYKSVVERMDGRKVVIRTADLGADKKAMYLRLDREENPAMGYRGIRISLDYVDMFKTQLRAIYRASAFGTVALLIPMIVSVEEIQKVKQICGGVKEKLSEEGIAFGEVELGIMIETPAAVMVSDLLAKEVDFFSIGTNDLTQYTLAMDRQNPKLDSIYDVRHEAILRMIRMVVENGHKERCKVGICGELAADMSLTASFLEMGVDEISVVPDMIFPIRKILVNL